MLQGGVCVCLCVYASACMCVCGVFIHLRSEPKVEEGRQGSCDDTVKVADGDIRIFEQGQKCLCEQGASTRAC